MTVRAEVGRETAAASWGVTGAVLLSIAVARLAACVFIVLGRASHLSARFIIGRDAQRTPRCASSSCPGARVAFAPYRGVPLR